MSSVELQSNELFEELTETELMTLVGGNGGLGVSEYDSTGRTSVSTDSGAKNVTISNTQTTPNLGTQTLTLHRT